MPAWTLEVMQCAINIISFPSFSSEISWFEPVYPKFNLKTWILIFEIYILLPRLQRVPIPTESLKSFWFTQICISWHPLSVISIIFCRLFVCQFQCSYSVSILYYKELKCFGVRWFSPTGWHWLHVRYSETLRNFFMSLNNSSVLFNGVW